MIAPSRNLLAASFGVIIMRVSAGRRSWLALFLALLPAAASEAQGTRDTTTYRRIKAALDAIPAIDTHDHLWPFDRLPGSSRPTEARA